MKKNNEILSKEFVKNYIYTVMTESDIGFANFVFVPVFDRNEEYEKAIAGFLVKEDGFRENGFVANVLILTTYKNEIDVVIPKELEEIGFTSKKQNTEFVEKFFTYNRLYKIASGKQFAESLTEIAMADLINLVFNQELNMRNLSNLEKQENFNKV